MACMELSGGALLYPDKSSVYVEAKHTNGEFA